jgi:hypothetical protein
MSGVGVGGVIHVKAPGYKQAELDCSAPGVDLSNVEIKLERLRYGDLRLKLLDEDGKPLPGATVDPAPYQNNNNYYYYVRRMQSAKKVSDAKGEVQFSGLSTGPRRINVIRDGYYLSDPARVVILPDAEATLTLMLRKGLAISGKLTGPAGEDFTRTVVSIRRVRDSSICTCAANAAGEFFVGGLAPDNYVLTADSPMSTLRAYQEIELTGESRTGLALELVPKGGIMVKLDKEMKGRMVYLQDKEIDKRKTPGIAGTSMNAAVRSYAYVDAEGLAEFWNVRPGHYRISAPANTRTVNVPDDKDTEKYASRVSCGTFSDVFEVKEPRKLTDMTAQNAISVNFPVSSASAVAKFVFRSSTPTATSPYQQFTQYLLIKGELCTGQYARSQRRTPTQGGGVGGSRLQVIGTLPAYLAPAATGTQTLIQNLVPGKYKILTYTYVYDNNRGTQEQTEEAEVAEFQVAAGERKSLGVIVIEPSKSAPRAITSRPARQYSEAETPTDEDLEPAFEP